MKSTRQQFADTMLSVGLEDPKLVVVVGDISHFNLQPFDKACPGRYYNIGICEPSMLSVGAGLAKVGLVPVIHTIAPFILERSLEQLKLDFGYHRLGGNIVTVGGAFDYSNLGCTHHCYNDIALMKTIEDSEIMLPGTPMEFDSLFKQSYRSGKLTLFRVSGVNHNVDIPTDQIKFGRGVKLSDGKDLTMVVTGPQLANAMAAKEALSQKGHSIELIYIHTVRPLDEELIVASVSKTKNVIVIEEHFEYGGLGDDVLRAVKNISGFKHVSQSIPNKFVRKYGSYDELCGSLCLDTPGIIRSVEKNFKI
jgi:transketolase